MIKDISQYLFLYIGCDLRVFSDGCKSSGTVVLTGENLNLAIESGWKPVLRPLSDITEEEMNEYSDLAYHYQHEYLRLIFHDGSQFKYLLSKRFDLFSLIESGLAIDGTKMKVRDTS